MILKIATGKGWKFIDNVEDINVESVDTTKPMVVERKLYADLFLYYWVIESEPEEKVGRWVLRTRGGGQTNSVVELMPTLKNGNTPLFIADLAVYLLSNEGKTIERIN